MSSEESALLVAFCNKYDRLITTAMEVIRYSGNDVDIFSKIITVKSHRDRSTYSVTLPSNNQTQRGLSRGRLVLTILRDYVANTDESKGSYENITQYFNLRKGALKLCSELCNCTSNNSGYLDKEDDVLTLADNEKYFVTTGWSDMYLERFIKCAETYQYRIEKEEKSNSVQL